MQDSRVENQEDRAALGGMGGGELKEERWRVRKPRPTRVIEQGCLGAIGGVMNIDIKTLGVLGALGMMAGLGISEEREAEPLVKKAFVDGRGQGWRAMEESEFVNVNCAEDTWSWEADGLIKCTGKPVGVIRTKEPVTNFELVVEWRHLESGGNSGVFVWASPASIKNLEAGKGRLPHGIEVQVLDLGYAEKYEKRHKKPSDWFTSHGDVFPTGPAKMTPFPPVAPNGKRSFPSKETTLGTGEWNHYYVRAINGEVRLWVNGEEVSGGTGCEPATGYLCLESEGAPVEFRGLRLRKLP